MNQAEYKAAFNEAIRTHRLAGKKFNVHDLLADIELQQIAKERHANNGNGSEPERRCWCLELIVNGKRIPCPPHHDCEYVAARSALVFEASRIATQRVGDPVGSAALDRQWTRVFNWEMTRLAAPLLKQSGNGSVREQKAV
jgi:hypothetical protein